MGIVVSRHFNDRVEAIMKMTGLSRVVVETVLQSDRDFIWNTLREGKRAVVLGVASLTPYSTHDGTLTVRCRVSGGLRSYLNGFYAPEGLPVLESRKVKSNEGNSEDDDFSDVDEEDEEI